MKNKITKHPFSMKLNTNLIVLFISIASSLFSQTPEENERINKKSVIVMKSELFGVKYLEQLVIPVEFDDIYVIVNGKNPLLCVRKNDGYGIYTSTGEIILPVSFTTIDENGSIIMLDKKGKKGILGFDGKIRLEAIYDKIEDLEGSGYILTIGDKSGVANIKGEIIIPITYNSVKQCDYEKNTFQVETDNNKTIYIENTYNPIITPMDGYIASSSSLFFKTTELSIVDWFAFLADSPNYDGLFNINSLIPDTTKVEKKLLPIYRLLINEIKNEEDSHLKYYTYKFTSSKKVISSIDIRITDLLYKNKLETMLYFPITGITYEQTIDYLKWLNLKYKSDNISIYYDATFRLPTPKEWEQASNEGLSNEMKYNKCLDSVNIKNCMLFIYKDLPKCSNYDDYIKNSFGIGSVGVNMFNPNFIGLFNNFGNVAEMTSQKGISKGGSFYHSAKEAKIDNSITYEIAEPWLGVRIVVEMKCQE